MPVRQQLFAGRKTAGPWTGGSLRFVAMRASEQHKQHNKIHGELLGNLELRQQELYTLVPGGEAAFHRGKPVVAPAGGEVEKAALAVRAAQATVDAHIRIELTHVRAYRIVDLDGEQEHGRFTDEYFLAPKRAAALMLEKQISQYDLQEQLPDGTWVSYYPGPDQR